MKTAYIYIVLVLLLGSVCKAEIRTWEAVNGNKVEAEFISVLKGTVSLRLKSGKIFKVSRDKLSKEDNEFISSLFTPKVVGDGVKKKLNPRFSDHRGGVTVEILRILTGDEIVSNEKLHNFTLESIRSKDKKAIYFEVKVTNNKYDGELYVNDDNFQLESTAGEVFSSVQTRDYISGEIHKGRFVRGGFAFKIYNDSTPKILRYKTGLKYDGTPMVAVSPDLRSLIPKKEDSKPSIINK